MNRLTPKALQAALAHEGLEAHSKFTLPGTGHVATLYLSSIPRAAIEICQTRQAADDLLEAWPDVVEGFGGRLELNLVLLDALASRPPDLGDSGIHWILPMEEVLSPSMDDAQFARAAAAAISRLRGGPPEASAGHTPVASMTGLPGLGGVVGTVIGGAIGRMWARGRSPKSVPVPRRRSGIAGDMDVMLKTLEELVVDPTRLLVIQGEVAQLITEFDQEHYTACALRAGRCLEYVIYSAAKAWGAAIDEPVLQAIHRLENQAREAGRALVDMVAALKHERDDRRRAALQKGQILKETMERLVTSLDAHESSDGTQPAVPRNVGAILTDVRRAFAGRPEVERQIKALKDGRLVPKIMQLRNAAAHADMGGRAREVERHEVEEMLRALQAVLNQLASLGEAIQLAGGGARA